MNHTIAILLVLGALAMPAGDRVGVVGHADECCDGHDDGGTDEAGPDEGSEPCPPFCPDCAAGGCCWQPAPRLPGGVRLLVARPSGVTVCLGGDECGAPPSPPPDEWLHVPKGLLA